MKRSRRQTYYRGLLREQVFQKKKTKITQMRNKTDILKGSL